LERFKHGGDIYSNHGVQLDFSVNTNPFGLPDPVREALIARTEDFSNYPDPLCRELCSAIASYENVKREWIICGNGAADLIYRICFALKPKKALVCAPTFTEYERALEQVGSEVIYHVLAANNGFDVTDELIDYIRPGLDMLFLCHPNNPTGRLIPNNLMERIMVCAQQTNTIIVVDECFLDFTNGSSAKRFLPEVPGLCILKAFTKMYAMAGLRLGHMIASNTMLIQKINAAAQCWSVSVPAQIAGIAALNCEDWIDKTIRLISEERHFLSSQLEKLGIKVFCSDANYLLVHSKHPLYEMLLHKGIMIRSCENFRGLDSSYYRIGIKKRQENDFLIQTIKELL